MVRHLHLRADRRARSLVDFHIRKHYLAHSPVARHDLRRHRLEKVLCSSTVTNLSFFFCRLSLGSSGTAAEASAGGSGSSPRPATFSIAGGSLIPGRT